VRNEGAALWYE
jgi:hypothetical protein